MLESVREPRAVHNGRRVPRGPGARGPTGDGRPRDLARVTASTSVGHEACPREAKRPKIAFGRPPPHWRLRPPAPARPTPESAARPERGGGRRQRLLSGLAPRADEVDRATRGAPLGGPRPPPPAPDALLPCSAAASSQSPAPGRRAAT